MMKYLTGFQSVATALARNEAARDSFCAYQNCPTPKAERGTKLQWTMRQHPARPEWALEVPDPEVYLLLDWESLALQTAAAMTADGWVIEVEP
jgi:hypothetical protein